MKKKTVFLALYFLLSVHISKVQNLFNTCTDIFEKAFPKNQTKNTYDHSDNFVLIDNEIGFIRFEKPHLNTSSLFFTDVWGNYNECLESNHNHPRSWTKISTCINIPSFFYLRDDDQIENTKAQTFKGKIKNLPVKFPLDKWNIYINTNRKKSGNLLAVSFKNLFEKLLCFLALSLTTYAYNVIRLRPIKQKNNKLEEIIKIKTNALDLTLKELEISKNKMGQQIHIYSRLLASISHDVESPLRYIAFASRQIPGMINKNQFTQAANLGLKISDVSERLSIMVNDLLDYIKVHFYGNRLHFESVNLKALIDLKFELFKNIIEKNGNYFINEISPFQTVLSDQRLLSIVIHNLIDNAAKNTYNGKITIHSEISENQNFKIMISNTGTGISSRFVDMVNSQMDKKSLHELIDNEQISGLGLLLVKEVGELAGISIKVTQTDITSFHLYFESTTE